MAQSSGLFKVNILSETGSVYSGTCSALFVPAEKDTVVVLAYHTPMIMKLGKGNVSIKIGREKRQLIDVNSGLIYVGDNEATVLANL
jgi:F0F1-type ATP synthase epsilon subunit